MTIAEVAEKYSLTPDTLRYYERIGLLPKVGRTPGGIRDYKKQDCDWIVFIKCMRAAGLPVEVLIEYVSLFNEGDSTVAARKELLTEQRDQLKRESQSLKALSQDSTKRLKTMRASASRSRIS